MKMDRNKRPGEVSLILRHPNRVDRLVSKLESLKEMSKPLNPQLVYLGVTAAQALQALDSGIYPMPSMIDGKLQFLYATDGSDNHYGVTQKPEQFDEDEFRQLLNSRIEQERTQGFH
jgi:hypothetical protein